MYGFYKLMLNVLNENVYGKFRHIKSILWNVITPFTIIISFQIYGRIIYGVVPLQMIKLFTVDKNNT